MAYPDCSSRDLGQQEGRNYVYKDELCYLPTIFALSVYKESPKEQGQRKTVTVMVDS